MSTATERMPTAGEVFHVELRSADAEGTRTFMSKVFGWEFTETPHPAFHLVSTPGGGEGHIGPVQDADEGPAVISYVLVEDLDATASEIEANGGKVLQPREEAPGQGSYLTFRAPGGETMVAWENA